MEDEREADFGQPTKLFVGQIPREMTEEDLATYFEGYGPIRELSIIRDPLTTQSKGCAFLTYVHHQSALQAVETLHDRMKLPNALNPLQVRFAETPLDRENKLFVGMLPKTFTEQELQQMFQPFGELKEVHIIRGSEGSPKGCAFVKFVSKEAAMMAIDNLNETIPHGATRPLVVKFADNKKAPKLSNNGKPDFWYGANEPLPYENSPSAGQNDMGYPYPYGRNPNFLPPTRYGPGDGSGGPPPPPPALHIHGIPTMHSPPLMSHKQMYPHFSQGMGMFPEHERKDLAGMPIASMAAPMASMAVSAPMGHLSGGHLSGGGAPMMMGNSSPPMGAIRGPPPAREGGGMNSHTGDSMSSHSRPPEGPSGANLFIYHLPRDLTDADLATLFAPFGNVISAKVFVDKKTSDSKGFGFVSYDSFESANTAIESMNGFQIGSKRLKVQHKRVGGGGGGGSGGHGLDDGFAYNGGPMHGSSLSGPPQGMRAIPQPHNQQLLLPPHMSPGNHHQPMSNDGGLSMFSRYDIGGGNYIVAESNRSAPMHHPHINIGMRYYQPSPPTHTSSPVAMHMGMHMNRPTLSAHPQQILSFQHGPVMMAPSQSQQMNVLQSSFESFGLHPSSEQPNGGTGEN